MIQANVQSSSQITASVSDEKISATVSGGIGPPGPQGPSGASNWSEIVGKPATFQPSQHTHDDRYYTEGEVDTLLAGKQATGSYAAAVHTHTISAVDGLQAALDGKQAAGSYAATVHSHTISQVTGLQGALDSKQAAGDYAPLTHTHTIAQVIGLQSTLNSLAPVTHGHIITDVDGLSAALAGKQAAGDYAPLVHQHVIGDTAGLQAALDGKQAAGSYAQAVHNHSISAVIGLQAALDGKQESGAYATLVNGKVPATQLPSYVDDILEFDTRSQFPASGEEGKLYITIDTTKLYRWAGTTYVEIVASPGSTDVIVEGSTNLFFTTARAVSAVQSLLDAKAATVHSHVAADISDFTSAVVAAAPPTTNASLLTSGTLSADRLPGTVVLTTDARLSDARQPLSHQHVIADTTGLQAALDSKQAAGSYASASHAHPASAITDFASAVAAASPEEVIEYQTAANFPATGQDGKLYVATDTSRVYSWATNVYAEVGPTASLYDVSHTHDDRYYTESEVDSLLAGKQAAGSYVLTTDGRLADARAPLSHAHGNITNAGAIGSAGGQVVVTTTDGVLTTAATISSAIVSGLGTIATQNANAVAITGGAINGTTIGATTASTGSFTTVATTGNVGVGTASPAARLDVRRTNAYVIMCDNAYTSAEFGPREANDGFCSVRFSWSTYGSGNNWGFDCGSDRMTWAQIVSNTRTEWITLRSNNLGIGTNNPTISSGIGLHVNGSTVRLGTARTPASASATGNQGEICWDSSYLYICTATNTWRRIAHSTW